MRKAKVIAGHPSMGVAWKRLGAAIYVQAIRDLEDPNIQASLDAFIWLFSDTAQLILDVCDLGNRHPSALFAQKGSQKVAINASIAALFEGLSPKETEHLVRMLLKTGREGRAAILDARQNYWQQKAGQRKAGAK